MLGRVALLFVVCSCMNNEQIYSAEYQIDSRSFTRQSVEYFSTSDNFDCFGFVDFDSDIGSSSSQPDSFFFRFNTKAHIFDELGAAVELQGQPGDLTPKLGICYDFVFAPIQSLTFVVNKHGGYQQRFISFFDIYGPLSYSGFADVNIDDEFDIVVLTEQQLRAKVYDNLQTFIEFKLNKYLDDNIGVGIGLRADW